MWDSFHYLPREFDVGVSSLDFVDLIVYAIGDEFEAYW